jgi:hypothetical protein
MPSRTLGQTQGAAGGADPPTPAPPLAAPSPDYHHVTVQQRPCRDRRKRPSPRSIGSAFHPARPAPVTETPWTASIIAKQALNGQKVVVVRCEEVNVSGSFFRLKVRSALGSYQSILMPAIATIPQFPPQEAVSCAKLLPGFIQCRTQSRQPQEERSFPLPRPLQDRLPHHSRHDPTQDIARSRRAPAHQAL